MNDIAMINAIKELAGVPAVRNDGDEISCILRSNKNALDYHRLNLDRCIENWKYYWGLYNQQGMGQFDASALAQMNDEDREVMTFNLCRPIIDTIAGGLMMLPIDPDFYPVDDEVTSLTIAMKKAMYSDKDLLDWQSAFFQADTHGLIFEAVLRYVISYEYNELGNLGFEVKLPGSVIADPYWKSPRSKDCKKCWEELWLTPARMIELWPEKEDMIRRNMREYKKKREEYRADEFGNYTGIIPYHTSEEAWGQALRVIQQYRVEEKTIDMEIALTASGEHEIPQMEDLDKPEWLNRNVPEWHPEYVYKKKRTIRHCDVDVVCPSLSTSEKLASGPCEIQIGCLPFKWWSAARMNGESSSSMDSVISIQKSYNYLHNMVMHKLQVQGVGGATMIGGAGFSSEREKQKAVHNLNVPGEVIQVADGVLLGGRSPVKQAIEYGNQGVSEAYQQMNHLIDRDIPFVTKVTAVTRGMGTDSNTSGYLYRQQKIQADQQLYSIHLSRRNFYIELFDGWLTQAIQLYSNEGLERTFGEGENKTVLNERSQLPDGTEIIKNDVSSLKNIRHKIIVDETQQSPTDKIEMIVL